LTKPSAPLNLANDQLITKATQIGIKWDAPTETGGVVILDYRISLFDTSINDFSPVHSGAIYRTYSILGLVAGRTYRIKVQARNLIGYSVFSEELSVLAA